MYKIMTFAPNGHPTPFENKTYSTRKEADERMLELKKIYDNPMYISHKQINQT